MPRTAAKFTKADIRRATEAGLEAGADRVELKPNGTIAVMLKPSTGQDRTEETPLAPGEESTL